MVKTEVLLLVQDPPDALSARVKDKPAQAVVNPVIIEGSGLTVKTSVLVQLVPSE
jgi:hypothetical protein